MIMSSRSQQLFKARHSLVSPYDATRKSEDAAEGGCGVLGLASSIPVKGRHVLASSRQMHNRGNGKGGGIAMAGLEPQQVGVNADVLQSNNLIQIALMDSSVRQPLEEKYLLPYFDMAHRYELPHIDDYKTIPGLDVQPPDVWRYFVRVKPDVLAQFAAQHHLEELPARSVEDEFIYQNSFNLNKEYYASLGDKRAFVLSHGRNLSVLKIVGYAEDVVEYYQLQDQTAHIWIAHQRYPTKGRVWHPGGAHPFVGLNEALVHNGDFANYHALGEYLRQRNISPLFLTDTEVGAQLFDLFDRTYQYPLEVTLEALAPTTEYDFSMLPDDRQELYQAVQNSHLHASPDGPWFFIVARTAMDEQKMQLLGITDTSMLRPQVFALYENSEPGDAPAIQLGLIASERQAINACLESLEQENPRIQPQADQYWCARGGSYTDGGAFVFNYAPETGLTCSNKFGEAVTVEAGKSHYNPQAASVETASPEFLSALGESILLAFDDGGAPTLELTLQQQLAQASWPDVAGAFDLLADFGGKGDLEWQFALDTFTLLRDRPPELGDKKRSSFISLADGHIYRVLDSALDLTMAGNGFQRKIEWDSRTGLRPMTADERTLVINASGFTPEGESSAARFIVEASQAHWKHIIAYNWRGGRFAGSGLGADSQGLRIDLYGNAGDYAASGLDGAEVHLHGDGQDQLGQIMRRGKLVVYGDVGQTFLYGAKGGEVYVRGSAAGRPLINAVGSPRVVINGTCLDYLAESFMAGDPLDGGGFAILNGVRLDEHGQFMEMETPYPGGNLLSLASGGAIYVRDPHHKIHTDQLNGGHFARFTEHDWELLLPYLKENERLFGIKLEELLTVGGQLQVPAEVYRKISPDNMQVLQDNQ
jgi:glutamate synthase domain-containing protein 1/glutamate synthase domain-containing protein 3